MANLKIYIDPKKKKKNGESSIFITVNLQYKKLFFFTGVSCDPDKFDLTTNKIKGNSKEVKDGNLIIDRCVASLNDIFVRYRLQNIELTPELLKREWKNPTRRIDFFTFFDEVFKERKNDIAEGTYKQHQSSIDKLKEFINERNKGISTNTRKPTTLATPGKKKKKVYTDKLAFSEIDSEMVEAYRRWLKMVKGNDLNTIYTALKNFKTYVNIAKRKGVIDHSPFDNYRLRKSNPDRIFLTEAELQSLWQLYEKDYLADGDQRVLRHFLFMCFTGLRISDLKSITPDSIVGNVLVYSAVKTRSIKSGQTVKVPLNLYAKKLIADEATKTGLLFNCLSDQKMNVKIKDIVKAAKPKILKDVSNHSARHTFATLWMNKTKDVLALQKLLGHSDISQTMIYAHITDGMIAAEMNNFENTLFVEKQTK